MLEVRYKTDTKELTAWCGRGKQFGNLAREGHTVIVLDTPIPNKPLGAWLVDSDKLISNPNYVEPEPVIDPLVELEKRIKALEKK